MTATRFLQVVALVVLARVANAAPLVLCETRAHTGGDPTGIVSYESGDCTGTPLVGGGGSIPVVQTVADTVFFPMTPTTAGMINSIERTNRSYGCTSITPHGGCCRTQISGIGNPYAAGTVPFANLGIVRPLHAVSTIP